LSVGARSQDAAAEGDGDAEAGAAFALVVPPANVAAPINLVRIVIAAGVDPGPPTLLGPGAGQLPTLPLPGALACGAAACRGILLTEALLPNARYQVVAGGGALPLATGAGADTTAPSLLAPTLAWDGPQVIVRLAADEPVTAELRDEAGKTLAQSDVAALAQELCGEPQSGAQLSVVVRDLAGNVAGALVPVALPPARPRLAITELCAHPKGPRPAQQWVELRNLDAETADTTGMHILAGGGESALPSALLPAGAYALVVGAGFDAASAVDVPPRPGTILLRLAGAAIGRGLVSAGGGAVELHDALATPLSRYGGFLDTSARMAAGSSVERVGEAACDLRANWQVRATPSPGGPSPP
jgi:hypothetical protein